MYDALTTKRVYNEAFSHEVSRKIIVDSSSSHFDPRLVDAFLEIEDQFIEIKELYSGEESLDFNQLIGGMVYGQVL